MQTIVIVLMLLFLSTASFDSFGQILRRNSEMNSGRYVPFGSVIGYETRYGGSPQVGLWYFRPVSNGRLEVRWWRLQGTYGWNENYKSINVTGVYNFLIAGLGLNVNTLSDNEGGMNWALQPVIDIDLVYLTVFFGYNVNVVEEINVDDQFNITFQVDLLALADTFFRK